MLGITDSKWYQDIADKIRTYMPSFKKSQPSEFPQAVENLFLYGTQMGQEAGYQIGYDHGLELGKQAEYDRFWDANQDNGNRENYRYGYYGLGWTDDNFHPKHKFKPTVATGMFQSCRATVFDALLDMSQVTDATNMFNGARFLELPELNMTDATYSKAGMFAGSAVRKLAIRVSANTTYANDMFNIANGMKELIIIGTIGQNGLNVQWSPLNHESLMSIINALQDKTADSSGTSWVCTLGSTNLAKLTDAEKAIATQKGWSLA